MSRVLPDQMPHFLSIDIDLLLFDPENPRLPKSIDGQDPQSVLAFMLDDASLVELMRSIAAQGFFPGEPLLVCEAVGRQGSFVVVEGNRRLAAAMLLANPDLAPMAQSAVRAVAALVNAEEIKSIPCLVFPTYSSILAHLGYRHITGVKEWEPLAKARYLRRQFDDAEGDDSERFRTVARSIGSRADYVGRLLTSLAIYELWENKDFYAMNGVSEHSIQFSLLSSALSYKNIYAFLGLSSPHDLELTGLEEENLQFLLSFIFELDEGGLTRLLESRNLGKLTRILGDQTATAALRDGAGILEAETLLGDSIVMVEAVAKRSTSQIQTLLERLDEASISNSDIRAVEILVEQVQLLLTRVSEMKRASQN